MDTEEDIIQKYFVLHNEGVALRNFERLISLFAPDATLSFQGIDIGPFIGKDNIAAAYSIYPPANEIFISGAIRKGVFIVADYTLTAKSDRISGRIKIWLTTNDLISKLIIEINKNIAY